MRRGWATAALFSGLMLFPRESLGGEKNGETLPFSPGESLTYKLSWGIFNVGTAVMEVRDIAAVGGSAAYEFNFRVRTNRFADAFYKVRDEYTGFADLSMRRSVLFRKKESHNRRSRDVEVTFDWKSGTVQYANAGKAREPLPLPDQAFDPLSGLFAARMLPFREGKTFAMVITDGKKLGALPFKVDRREVLKTKAGVFDAFLLSLNMKNISKVFSRSKKTFLKVWVSNDAARIPLRMVGKVGWGRFRADLVSLRRPEEHQAVDMAGLDPSPEIVKLPD